MRYILLSMALLLSGSCVLAADLPASVASLSATPGDAPPPPLLRSGGYVNTTTYLRCYYRVEAKASNPAAHYVWARNPQSSGYYRIKGNWRDGGVLLNMFYTSTPQSELQQVCQRTLASRGMSQSVDFFAAADSALSYDYTVWTLGDPADTRRFDRIVTFGDSLTDNRNVFNATQWLLPNSTSWFHGHFTNGRVWAEVVADTLGLPLYNWAVGAAGADQMVVIPGIPQQVESWKQYVKYDSGYKPEKTLFTVLIGGNDLVNYGKTVDEILSAESAGLETLIQAGGRHILLMNLPDVSRVPLFQRRKDTQVVANQVLDYNKRLQVVRDALVNKYGSQLDIRIFDTYSLFADLLDNPASYGLTNTRQPCLDVGDSPLIYATSHKVSAQCSNADSYIFWDTLHPTRRTHELMAQKAIPMLKDMLLN